MAKGSYIAQTPAIISSCALWLDAADLSTITAASNLVSSWLDKSGNKNNATQETAASQPSSRTRSFNGRNVLDFDGINDLLTLASNNIFDQPFTSFVVAQANAINATGSFISRQSAAESGGFNIRVNGDSTNFTAFGVGESTTFSVVSQPSVNTNMNIHNVSFNLATSYSINNGTVITANTLATYNNAISRNATIGALQSNVEYFNGAIAEIIFYNRVIRSDERLNILRYLSNKWGIAIL